MREHPIQVKDSSYILIYSIYTILDFYCREYRNNLGFLICVVLNNVIEYENHSKVD